MRNSVLFTILVVVIIIFSLPTLFLLSFSGTTLNEIAPRSATTVDTNRYLKKPASDLTTIEDFNNDLFLAIDQKKKFSLMHVDALLNKDGHFQKCEYETSYRGFKEIYSVCDRCFGDVCDAFSFVTIFEHKKLETSILLLRNIGMNVKRIKCIGGGEDVHSVFRREEDEIPTFKYGSFLMEGNKYCANHKVSLDVKLSLYQKAILYSLDFYDSYPEIPTCQYVPIPTIFITRYEYANLWHVVTDFYNTFLTLRVANLVERDPQSKHWVVRPHQIIWLDAHAKGNLDDAWIFLFQSANVTRLHSWVENVQQNSLSDCMSLFAESWVVPAGHESPMENFDLYGCREQTGAWREFISFVTDRVEIPPFTSRKIILVLRRDYVSHPRNQRGTVYRKISNEQEVVEAIQTIPCVSGFAVDFSTLSFQEQAKMVGSANILVGLHGAGLTHAIWMDKRATLLEIPLEDEQPHFGMTSKFSGINYISRGLTKKVDDYYYHVFTEPLVKQISHILSDAVCISDDEFVVL